MSISIKEINKESVVRCEIIDAYEGSRKISIGRALVGGSLLGDVGAVLGGLTGKTGDRKYKVLVVMKDGRHEILTCTENELKEIVNRAAGNYRSVSPDYSGGKWIGLGVIVLVLIIWFVWYLVSSIPATIKYSKLNEDQREYAAWCQSVGHSRSDCIDIASRRDH